MNHACAASALMTGPWNRDRPWSSTWDSVLLVNYHTYMSVRKSQGSRSTQAERSARSRGALLEAAARGLSRYGYANLALEQVARDAGYTRGALYHQFKDKEDLAL